MHIDLSKEARAAEIEVVLEEEEDKGKAALTELFYGVRKCFNTFVKKLLTKLMRDCSLPTIWRLANNGNRCKEIKKKFRELLWMRYKLKD